MEQSPMKIDSAILTMVSEELHEYRDDYETFWDTLDGETDVMDAVGAILEMIISAQADEAAAKFKADTYKQLCDKHKARQDSLKRSLMGILNATGQRKIPHSFGTVSLREGTESVVIHNEKEIPSQLCKVTVTPDKAEIKKQMKAGVQIDGAELVTGPQTISIRMK
jgi:hypothetical protein